MELLFDFIIYGDYMGHYRWLHITDIHSTSSIVDSNFKESFLEEVKREISGKNKAVDCIIFTGDLFNRGKWTNEDRDKVEKFLMEIYEQCSMVGGWNWEKGQPMTRFFYCPGNHDLNRNAAYQHDERDSKIYRSDILSDVVKTSSLGTLTFSNNHSQNYTTEDEENYKLFTKEAFSPFFNVMNSLTQNESNYNQVGAGDYSYEVRTFHAKNENFSIVFVAINTSILAGQQFKRNDICTQMSEVYKHFKECQITQDYKGALNEYKKYVTLASKSNGLITDDKEHLCFLREKAQEQLIEKINAMDNDPIIIFMGHHPLNWFSKEGRDSLLGLMRKLKVKIYLCGHEHKVKYKELTSLPGGTKFHYYQISVGGPFSDSSNFNQCGFSIGTLLSGDDLPEEYSSLPEAVCANIELFQYGPTPKIINASAENCSENNEFGWTQFPYQPFPIDKYERPVYKKIDNSKEVKKVKEKCKNKRAREEIIDKIPDEKKEVKNVDDIKEKNIPFTVKDWLEDISNLKSEGD